MDYIFFFYGLAFIGLGVVSYILSKEVKPRLPWVWMALFGFTYGVNEWMNLAALAWQDGVWLMACRWAFIAASFLFLVEFARLSLVWRRGRGPGRWILGVLALGAVLGALDGWNGLNATTRYTLGLMGSLGAGWALYAAGRAAEARGRPWLLAGGVGLMVYGLAAGLVTPRAGFFPAAMLNYENFAELTGLPVQLIQGLLALGISGMIVGYFQASWPAGHEGGHRVRAHYMHGTSLILGLILFSGWFFTQYMGGLGWDHMRHHSLAQNQLAIQRLVFEVNSAEEAVIAMSGSPGLGPVLWSGSPQTLAQANQVLDRYQRHFGASEAYLLNSSGITIASSNRHAQDSFVGQSYAFRPYFHEAMMGNQGRYFALGVTSKKRGFYASSPVRHQAGKIMGVAVLKNTLNRFQQDMRNFDPAFLIDSQGIVLVASRANLDFCSLWPVIAAGSENFKIQYGTDQFTPIFSQPVHDNTKVEFDGRTYVVARNNVPSDIAPGWAVVNLQPFDIVIHYRFMGIAVTFILVILTMVFAGSNLSIRAGANQIMASESRFRAIWAAAPEAVFVYDPESRKILDANPFMAQWLGYAPEELVGMDIDQVRGAEAPGPREESAWEGSGELPLTAGLCYRKRDGSLVHVESTAAKIIHEDRTRELVFVRDITARQGAETKLAWEARVNASIADLSRALLSALPIDEVTTLVTRHAKNLTDSPRAFCGYINPLTGALVVPDLHQEACGVDHRMIAYHKFAGLWGWVLEHGQPLMTNNPYEDPRSVGVPPGHFPVRRFLSVPAMIEGKLVGQIGLANAPRDYTARDQEICERLAQLYALAIHRQRSDDTLRESEKGLQTILDNVQTGILVIDPETHVIVDANPVAVGIVGAPKEQIVGSPCQEFICAVEKDICPVTDRQETVKEVERVLRRADGENRWVLQTVVSVSMHGKGYLLENFVDITDRRQWEEAIQTTNDKLHTLVAQVEERNRTMTLANEMADMLQACQASSEAYEAIGFFMPRFFPDAAGSLYILNNSRNLFEAVASWGKMPPAVSVFAPDECWSVRRGRLHKVQDPQEALLCRHVPEAYAGGYLCVPLIAQGETLGVFHIQFRPPAGEQAAGLAVAEEQLALAVAEDMSLALANLRLRETLRSQAIRDPLTGLFNRRYMEETIERELNRVRRLGGPLGVVMMDLDHFKQYNDTFGHQAGDEILTALGNLLKSQVRGEDIACRYGGEEFLLIMPGTSAEVALERAEMLRQLVKEMHLHYPGLKPISLSLGVAVFPDHGDTSLEIIRAADAALYRAKRAGRDRAMTAKYAGETIIAKLPPPPFALGSR